MKPFSLDTVLNHRKSLEDQAIYRLAEAREEERRAQQQLADEEMRLATLIDAFTREQAVGIEVVKLARYEQRIILLEKQIVTLRAILRQKKEEVNRARNHLLARSKDRKIMETLRQKQNEAWQLFLKQKETATLDEVAVIFHNRE